MASDKQYRAVFGLVQFDVTDAEAAGKAIRKVTVREVGFKDQSVNVSCTLWPSHAGFQVERGDVVFFEGVYSQGSGKRQDGTPVTYHNLSVNKAKNFGQADGGSDVDVVNSSGADAPEDDDIPF